jgi:hypothetical protein
MRKVGDLVIVPDMPNQPLGLLEKVVENGAFVRWWNEKTGSWSPLPPDGVTWDRMCDATAEDRTRLNFE